MNLPEYQARELFQSRQIPFPRSRVTSSAQEAGLIARQIGSERYVVKAQVPVGGRGKAGGVVSASSPEEVEDAARRLLRQGLRTAAPDGAAMPVRKVLIQEYVPVRDQYYLAVTMLSGEDCPVALFSREGGIGIEDQARSSPESVRKTRLDPFSGFRSHHLKKLFSGTGLSGKQERGITEIAGKMARMMLEEDVLVAEINPLGVTGDQKFYGLDAKIVLDNNAAFRHPGRMSVYEPDDPLEGMAAAAGISYVRLNGNIGCLVNGAGLAMEVVDVIHDVGGAAANFLDIGGGADRGKIARAFELLYADTHVQAVLITVYGGILRCDAVADGIIRTLEKKGAPWPIVVRIKGNNQDEAARLLAESGVPIYHEDGFFEAIQKVVTLAAS